MAGTSCLVWKVIRPETVSCPRVYNLTVADCCCLIAFWTCRECEKWNNIDTSLQQSIKRPDIEGERNNKTSPDKGTSLRLCLVFAGARTRNGLILILWWDIRVSAINQMLHISPAITAIVKIEHVRCSPDLGSVSTLIHHFYLSVIDEY